MKSTQEYNTNFKKEYQKAIQFLEKGCECGCSKTVPKEKFAKIRGQFQTLPKPSQDAFVMGQLFSMDEGETTTSSRFPKKERTNLRTFYRWNNRTPLCLKTYLNLLGVSRDYLEYVRNLLLLKEGLILRVHGGIDRIPRWENKMMIDEKVKRVVKNFISNYAERYGSPDPAGKKTRKTATRFLMLLPTNESYKSVHREFIDSRKADDKLKSLKYEAFRRLWHELTPHIQFLKPSTDLCDTCHKLKSEIHSCRDEKVKATQKKNLIGTENEKKSRETTIKRTQN